MTVERDGLGDRVIELESRLAFLEKTIEELNEVLYRQQGRLDDLTAELALLRRRLAGQGAAPQEEEGGHD